MTRTVTVELSTDQQKSLAWLLANENVSEPVSSLVTAKERLELRSVLKIKEEIQLQDGHTYMTAKGKEIKVYELDEPKEPEGWTFQDATKKGKDGGFYHTNGQYFKKGPSEHDLLEEV